MEKNKRDRLPDFYEIRYHSELLKEKIADDGMWCLIPGVDPNINSAKSKRRLKMNEALFSFIDAYFPEGPFAFEPNMRDGRFMFIPDNVYHQGMAVCASHMIPGALEVGHFWYPHDYCNGELKSYVDQVYVPTFTTTLKGELAEMVRGIYFDDTDDSTRDAYPRNLCDFPFNMGLSVRLEGDFMDDVETAAKTILDALANQDAQTRRNGDGLVMFMRQLVEGR
jgi:hypothetical protein